MFEVVDNWVNKNTKVIRNTFLLLLVLELILYLKFDSGSMKERLEDLWYILLLFVFMMLGTYIILKVPGNVKILRFFCNFSFYFFVSGFIGNIVIQLSTFLYSQDMLNSIIISFSLAGIILTCLFYKPRINNLQTD